MEQSRKRRGRSPNCPGISLRDALQRARKIYEEEHTHPADRLVIAKDLGYAGISGASATTIGALRQYGVLEDAGDGLRISEDAVAAFELPETSDGKHDAMVRMAFNPPLFNELRAQFPNSLPGEANLRHVLIKRGFLPKQADDVIQAYRENFELVGGAVTEYNKAGEVMKETVSSSPETLGVGLIRELGDGKSPGQALMNLGKKWGAPLLTQALVVSIPRNFVVNIAVQGDEIKKEDLTKIKSQFTRWIEGLEEAFE
jgi:hypothetical protein